MVAMKTCGAVAAALLLATGGAWAQGRVAFDHDEGAGWGRGRGMMLADARGFHDDEGMEEEEARWREEEARERALDALHAGFSARAEIVSIFLEAGKVDMALQELEGLEKKALAARDPSGEVREILTGAWVEAVEMLADQDRPEDAERVAQRALKHIPEASRGRGYLLMSLAQVFRHRGELDKAVQTLRQATVIFDRVGGEKGP